VMPVALLKTTRRRNVDDLQAHLQRELRTPLLESHGLIGHVQIHPSSDNDKQRNTCPM
jgi:hypothetical protein